MEEKRYLVNKAFFGKTTAFKVNYNEKQKQVYFRCGKRDGDKWAWEVAKMNELELGEILYFFRTETKKSVSFFHKFEDKSQTVGFNRDKETMFVKIGNISKSLTIGEQEVIRVLLERILWLMNTNK